MSEIWDLWVDSVGATGLSFGRSRVDNSAATDRVLVHAAPRVLSVTVRSADTGAVTAEGTGLTRTAEGPMSTLIREGSAIRL